jgi:mono/diheme cytochrome c family protein
MRLFVLSALVLLGGVGTGVGYLYGKYPDVPPPTSVRLPSTPEVVARGKYLFTHVAVCADCHSRRDWSKFAGPIDPSTLGVGGEEFAPELIPTLPGRLYGRNLTPAAIGNWTDGEIVRAITSGVTKDGRPLFPTMPYLNFGGAARDDIEAIVAYMRTLTPVPNRVPEREVSQLRHLMARTLPQPARFRHRPPASDKVAYGGYLANLAGCRDCHTPVDEHGDPRSGMDFAGGFEFRFPGGGSVRAANITPDADTGIGNMSEQIFVNRFKLYERIPDRVLTREQQRIQTVMPWKLFAGMTRDDLSAIYAYLRQRKPVIHRVQKFDARVAVTR